MNIRDVQWPPGIKAKVERKHGLSQEEVEEALLSPDSYIRKARESRYQVLARASDGAYILSIIVYVAGIARVISARRMTSSERRLFDSRGK